MTKTITRKQLINALIDTCNIQEVAAALEVDAADMMESLNSLIKANNRKRASKPSAETIANRKLAEDVAAEVIARGVEVTAKDVAEYATDADGMPMSTRKVGALLKNAYNMGLIAKSPYDWSVAHYAPIGFDFAVKPERKMRKKSKDTAEGTED